MLNKKISFLLLCITCTYSRKIVDELSVKNGGKWGSWQSPQYCPPGQYGVGYKLKIEGKQGYGDDTSLNGIELICGSKNGRNTYGTTITSGVGPWGDWHKSFARCPRGKFLTSFKLQVESPIGRGDDSAANFVVFRCRCGSCQKQIQQGNGYGFWGNYGLWSSSCPKYSAICGLKTKVESKQGKGDDSALNDVLFYCCR